MPVLSDSIAQAACSLTPGPPSAVAAALNSQFRRQNGHRCSVCADSHLVMHCRWKACPHTPHTTGLSSPGYLPSGGHPSKGMRHMPQTSSPASHVHAATACQFVISMLQVMAFHRTWFLRPRANTCMTVKMKPIQEQIPASLILQ